MLKLTISIPAYYQRTNADPAEHTTRYSQAARDPSSTSPISVLRTLHCDDPTIEAFVRCSS